MPEHKIGAESQADINSRLKAILRGAFSGPPTPLRDIPKRNGKSRSIRRSAAAKTRRTKKSHSK